MDTDLILLEQFIKKHPAQAVRTIEGLDDGEMAALVESIPSELAINLLNLMNIYQSSRCLKLLPISVTVELLDKMNRQKTELVMRQVEEGLRDKWLEGISPKVATILRQKLEFPPYAIGAVMAPLELILRQDMRVKDAIKILKSMKDRQLSSVGVVDDAGTLVGLIRSHELLMANENDIISVVMNEEIPKFFAYLPVESIKNHPAWLEYRSVPVVDNAGILVGMMDFETTHKNANEPGQELNSRVMETSSALGELYRIGLAAFLQSVNR